MASGLGVSDKPGCLKEVGDKKKTGQEGKMEWRVSRLILFEIWMAKGLCTHLGSQ